MRAGRDLDALVATNVMEWKLIGAVNEENSVWQLPDGKILGIQWSPSLDIAAAWEVVEKLGEPFFHMEHWGKEAPQRWVAVFRNARNEAVDGSASTAPLAICLAALKACGVKVAG